MPGSVVPDHLGSHRRLAYRAAIAQTGVALAAGIAATASSGRIAGLAAGIGAMSIALAGAVQAFVALGGGIQAPGSAFARLLLGTLAKWLVVAAVWWGAIGIIGKAPFAAVAGLLAAMVTHPLVVLLGTKVKRER
jgi:ATP synthase protein I